MLIGTIGQPSYKTEYGTAYITFAYKAPKIICYWMLGLHLFTAWFHKKFTKPEGYPIKNLGYSIKLVWRELPYYNSDGIMFCRYCFENELFQISNIHSQ